MRSIAYMWMGKLRNLDDSLDFALNEMPTEVAVKLHQRDVLLPEALKTELSAEYSWRFPSRTATFEIVYGGFFYSQSEPQKGKIIDTANNRLQHDLERIARLGIDVNGGRNQFDYSLM